MKVFLKINDENSKIEDITVNGYDVQISVKDASKPWELRLKEEAPEGVKFSKLDLEVVLWADEESSDDYDLEEYAHFKIMSDQEVVLQMEDFEESSLSRDLAQDIVESYKEEFLKNKAQMFAIARITGKKSKSRRRRSGKSTGRKTTNNRLWTDDELRLAFNLYKQYRLSVPQDVLERYIEENDFTRTADAMKMKLANFAALDPNVDSPGLERAGEQTKIFFETHYQELTE